MKDSEDLLHLFINCPYSAKWWGNMFNLFDVAWAFDGALSLNVFQLLRGPSQEAENNLKNRSKAMLAELSFKCNQ